MRPTVVLTLLKKEFLNIIRDKKSFIFMILLPLLMFPLLIGIMSVVLSSFTKVQDNNLTFGVNYELEETFQKYIDSSTDYKYKVVYKDESSLKQDFDDGKIGIYIIKKGNEYILHYDENNTSNIAKSYAIEELYLNYKDIYLTEKLAQEGINYKELKDSFKITHVQENITETGSLLPMLFSMALTMLITSTAYNVAIEITTSEKEKGTLETLLSMPIKKRELITSKYLTTTIMAIMSGILTYISLFVTLHFSKNTLEMFGITSISISPRILIIYFLTIIIFSVFLSGIILSLAIFSKSLKEAQNTLAPLETCMILISYLPMLGIQASIKNAIIPFANIALLFNNALSSNLDTTFIILTFLSTITYAMILIIIVSKLYNEEDVLFNSTNLKNISLVKGRVRTICFTPFTSILILILVYFLALYFSILTLNTSRYMLVLAMPITIFVVIIISSIIIKLDVKKAFLLNKFSFKKFIFSLFIFVGTMIVSGYVVDLVAKCFPETLHDITLIDRMLNFDNVWISIAIVALAPALCEELMFRGVVLNSFAKKYTPTIGIIISALLFGIYHMNWLQGINAFFLGLALGYVYIKTKSIFVPMLLHFINNTYSTLQDYYPKFIPHFSISMKIIEITLAIVLIIIGLYLMRKKELRK